MEKKAKIQFLIVAIIASILSVGLAFYVLAPKSEPIVMEDDFSQKAYANRSLQLEEVSSLLKTEEPEEPEETEEKTEDVEEQPKKESTDEKTESEQEPESEQKPSEGEIQEGEIVETEEEKPVAPKKDLTMAIANAIQSVYTIDTDLEQGSGFLFNEKGDVVTNAHVAKDASYIVVTTSDGNQFDGYLIGISEKTDVALIRVPELAGKSPLPMETAKMDKGRRVFAIGSPENIANTSSEGEILSVGKSFFDEYEYNDLYEMNARIKKGSSGGPLIDAETERVIGINSLILVDNPEIGYAIPMFKVHSTLSKWAKDAKIDIEEGETQISFDEKTLTEFIQGYYSLIPYTLNDPEIDYYLSYVQMGSEAANAIPQFIDTLLEDSRTYDKIDETIENVTIGESEAKIDVHVRMLYHQTEDDEVYEVVYNVQHVIIIDQYGDYKISKSIIQE